jgi:hypothetical protein
MALGGILQPQQIFPNIYIVPTNIDFHGQHMKDNWKILILI